MGQYDYSSIAESNFTKISRTGNTNKMPLNTRLSCYYLEISWRLEGFFHLYAFYLPRLWSFQGRYGVSQTLYVKKLIIIGEESVCEKIEKKVRLYF